MEVTNEQTADGDGDVVEDAKAGPFRPERMMRPASQGATHAQRKRVIGCAKRAADRCQRSAD